MSKRMQQHITNPAWPFPLQRHFDNHSLTIDVAQDEQMLEAVFRLRYEIFKEEMGCNPSEDDNGIDRDRYDTFCDHLVIIDNDTDNVIGTYRLLRHDVAKANIGFYSENEFDLSDIYEKQMKFAEIGRACIKKAYRDQAIIALLWAGIGSFCHYYNIEYIGGCTTIGTDAAVAQRIYQYAKENDCLLDDSYTITALAANHTQGFDIEHVVDTHNVKRELPPLLRAYFAMGAKLAPIPAYDPDFDVIDFFTLLNFNLDIKRITRFIAK